MSYRCSLRLFSLLSLVLYTTAAPRRSQFVQFYPISQSQYDAILRMTEGEPVISEGRLINSGFRTLNDLRNSISNDINTGFQQILNVTGFLPSSTKSNKEKVDGYPLCVIKTSEADYADSGDADDDDDDDDGNNDNPEVDGQLSQGRAENENDDDYIDNNRPIVSCIVVVKSKERDHKKPSKTNTQHLRTPIPVLPYYYQPYANPFGHYPSYPYHNYPYYEEGRHYSAHEPDRRPAKTTSFKRISDVMSRSNTPQNIRPRIRDNANTGRSSYSTYYPYNYGSYNGGCQNNAFSPYNQIYAGGDYFNGQDGNDDSGEDNDISSEVADEIGNAEY